MAASVLAAMNDAAKSTAQIVGPHGMRAGRRASRVASKVRWHKNAWWVFTHAHGRRRTKRVGPTAKHKRLAQQLADRLNAKLVLGETIGPSESSQPEPVPFKGFAWAWYRREILFPYQHGEADALAAKSVQAREQHIRLHLEPHFGDADIRELRIADVQAFHDGYLETRRQQNLARQAAGKCPRPAHLGTLHTILGTLRRILADAQARELVAINAVDAWKAGKGRRRGAGLRPVDDAKVLSADELTLLLETTRQHFTEHYPMVQFLADTGCRISEALASRWDQVDLTAGTVRIEASIDFRGERVDTKTRRGRIVELSTRLRGVLAEFRPDLWGDSAVVFPSSTGGPQDYQNFRSRVFAKIVRKACGPDRRVTPHCLRHMFASLHLARGTNLKWVQEAGGWSSAKMLLDVYGHFMPTESAGFADALSAAPDGTRTAPTRRVATRNFRVTGASGRPRGEFLEPTIRLERTTCSLRVSCSTS